jgi:hypothetical protein
MESSECCSTGWRLPDASIVYWTRTTKGWRNPILASLKLRSSAAAPDDLYHVDVEGARAAGLRGVLLDEAGLYPDVDCPRVRSLEELVDQISRGVFD